MRRFSLAERLILFYVMISVIAVAVVGRLSYSIARDALIERTYHQLTSVKMLKKRQLEDFLNERKKDIDRLAQAFERPNYQDKNTPETILKAEVYLQNFLKNNAFFDKIYIWDSLGNAQLLLPGNPNTQDRRKKSRIKEIIFKTLFDKLKTGNAFIHDYITDTSGEISDLLICRQVTGPGPHVKGYLAAGISIPAIDAIMLENDPSRGLGTTGESYLVGRDYLFRSNSRFKGFKLMHSKVASEGVLNAFNLGEGTGIYKDYRGIKVLGSYGTLALPDLNWAIIAEIDVPEAFIPIYQLKSNILLVSIIISICVFLMTVILARRISRPIVKLKNAVGRIGEGVYDQVELPHSNDEIRELAVAFNKMAEELKQQSKELAEERLKRFSAMIDGQDLERQRLSMELHDSLGQSLIALRMKLESIIDLEKGPVNTTLSDITQGFDMTIDEIRRISNDLMPAVLHAFGLSTALRHLCNSIEKQGKISIETTVGEVSANLDERIQTYLFRITQEALNNVVKHSGSPKAWVNFYEDAASLNLEIRDEGTGFDYNPDIAGKGNGLYNMRERVILLNGSLEIISTGESGTTIKVKIPKKQ